MAGLILRELTAQDETAFFKGLEEYKHESLHLYTFDWKPGVAFSDHLERLHLNALGLELPKSHVASSILYGFVGDMIVGRVSIRHELNEYLRRRGGHIGYSVAPRFRRKGYGREIFQQTLEFCRLKLGLTRLMITCDDTNVASWRLLNRAGAVLEEKFFDKEDGSTARRYRLELTGEIDLRSDVGQNPETDPELR